MSAETMINVEVAYARPDKQVLKQLSVPQGTTAIEAVKQSGILAIFPEIDVDSDKFGVFSQVLSPGRVARTHFDAISIKKLIKKLMQKQISKKHENNCKMLPKWRRNR